MLKGGWVKKLIRMFDYLFLLRPTLFYPIWTFYLAGHWGGRTFGRDSATDMNGEGLLLAVALSLTVGSIFIFNQIQDRDTDKVNGKLFLLSENIIPLRTAYIEAVLLGSAGLVWGCLLLPRAGVLLALLILLSGWLYNYPPASWKDHAIMGMVTNGLSGLLIYSLGWMAGGGEGYIPLRGIAYMVAGASVYLITTLPDRTGDKATGKITFGVAYGITKTARWAFLLEAAALILAAFFRDWLLLAAGGVMLPFFLYGAWKETEREVTRATKFSVLALALAVTLIYPFYLVPILAVFFGSKWYYRIRFDFDYPSFKNE